MQKSILNNSKCILFTAQTGCDVRAAGLLPVDVDAVSGRRPAQCYEVLC